MIKTPEDFELTFTDIFGTTERATLSNVLDNQVRFDLGDDEKFPERVAQANERALAVLRACFEEKSFWLRIILWNEDEETERLQKQLSKKSEKYFSAQVDEYTVLYFQIIKYSDAITSPLVQSVVNYEMAIKPAANITCYYIDFESPTIVNIYDDRGMDVFSKDDGLINSISDRFRKWINNYERNRLQSL